MEDWIQQNISETTIEQSFDYIRKLRKYDEEYLVSVIEDHVKKNKEVNYIRLRPNGIDCIISGNLTFIELQKKYYKFGMEWLKIKR